MSSFDHKTALAAIPHKPGVYQYWDADGKLMYIGKAKDLRNRVGSYFNSDKNQFNGKTRVLVSRIRKITFTIVDTEIDAWLLENSLIKKHQPKFNINLKDDKTYPWIIVKNEHFPRIYWTRKVIKDGSTYFGPYGSIGMMHTILDLIKETYALRTCNLPLNEKILQKENLKFALNTRLETVKAPAKLYKARPITIKT